MRIVSQLYFAANFFNVWLSGRRLDPHILLMHPICCLIPCHVSSRKLYCALERARERTSQLMSQCFYENSFVLSDPRDSQGSPDHPLEAASLGVNLPFSVVGMWPSCVVTSLH